MRKKGGIKLTPGGITAQKSRQNAHLRGVTYSMDRANISYVSGSSSGHNTPRKGGARGNLDSSSESYMSQGEMKEAVRKIIKDVKKDKRSS